MQDEKVLTEEVIDDKPDQVKADLRKFNKAEDQVNKALAALSTVTEVKDQHDLEASLDIIARAKKVEKVIEKKRVSLVKPYNDEVKRINAHAKELAGKLPPAIKTASDAVLAYNNKLAAEAKQRLISARMDQLSTLEFVRNKTEEEWTAFVNGDIIVERYVVEQYDDANWKIKINQLVASINARNMQKLQELQKQKEVDDFFGDEQAASEVAAKIEEVKPVEAPVRHVPAFGSQKVKGITKRWTFEITDASAVPREYLIVDEAKIRAAMNAGERSIAGIRFYQTESLTSR